MSKSTNKHVLSHHLIGLSPTYWAFNPLLISCIHDNMLLINGIDTFVILDENKNNHGDFARSSGIDSDEQCNTSSDNVDKGNHFQSNKKRRLNTLQNQDCNIPPSGPATVYKAKHVIPMQKCLLVGIIQYVHCKSNGSISLVIDDGTGMIDCIYWLDDNEKEDDDYGDELIHAIRNIGKTNKSTHASSSSSVPPFERLSKKLQVGDLVSIRGQIRILSIDHERKIILDIQSNDSDQNLPTQPALSWESYFCTREVQIKYIEKINNGDDVNEESIHWLKSLQFIKRILNTQHIRRDDDSLQTSTQNDINNNVASPSAGLLGHVKEVDDDYITNEDFCLYNDGWNVRQQVSLVNLPTLDGLDMYNVLSNEMKDIIMSQNHHDQYEDVPIAIDNSTSNNSTSMSCHRSYMNEKEFLAIQINPTEKALRNYFGKKCRCRNHQTKSLSSSSSSVSSTISYVDELLYCQCNGTFEQLDKSWKFRNALLTKLLQMESIFCELTSNKKKDFNNNDNAEDVSKNNSSDGNDINMKQQESSLSSKEIQYFQFNFSTIYSDEELQSIAKEVVTKHQSSSSSSSCNNDKNLQQTNIRRLFINTFHHLRKDGILYLLDIDKDIYILLSKTRVLFPIVERMIVQSEQFTFCRQILQRRGSSGTIHSSSSSQQVGVLSSYLNNVPQRKINLLKRLIHIKRNCDVI